MTAFGAYCNTGEDTLAHLVVGSIVPAAPSQVFLSPFEERFGYQRRMGVLRHRPGILRNWDFFLGFDTDLPALG